VNKYKNNYYADTTIKSMTSKVKAFFAFLSQHSLILNNSRCTKPTIPTVTDKHLIFFAAYLIQTRHFKSAASIEQYVSAVRQWCKSNDRPDPAVKPDGTPTLAFYRFFKSIKRQFAGKTTTRVPLSISQLRQLMQALNTGLMFKPTDTLHMRAAILNAFQAMLRISEYTNTTTNTHTPGVHATRGDVEFFPDVHNPKGYRLTVHKSKTDQFRIGHTLTVYCTGDMEISAVKAMQQLFLLDPRPASHPLFKFGGSSSRAAFVAKLDAMLTVCDIPTSNIKTHSLRSGGATAYYQTGTDPLTIQKMGRWSSFCFTTYTWATTSHLQQAAARLASGLNSTTHVNLDIIRSPLI
jgi:integrase